MGLYGRKPDFAIEPESVGGLVARAIESKYLPWFSAKTELSKGIQPPSAEREGIQSMCSGFAVGSLRDVKVQSTP